MKQSLFSLFFFSFLILLDQSIDAKYVNPPRRNGLLLFKTEHAFFSRDFAESILLNHPLISSISIAGYLGYNLYQHDIKNFVYEHRHKIFQSSIALLAAAYLFKNKIITYCYDSIIDNQEDEKENHSDNDYSQFAQSGVKIYFPNEIDVTFQDVAGLHNAKQNLEDILLFLKHPEKFKKIGARIPKGILLTGSPGNGKTLLARALAGEVDCPFLSINASAFMEAIIGVGAARVRSLFAVAKELAPCIIFIDEIDTIGRKRSSSSMTSDNELAQTLNQLLSEMDGFEQYETPIIIIGATNRADILDKALIRPGRFDRHINIHMPYIQDRIEILQVHLNKVRHDISIDINQIAHATQGFSGAELANLINEAAIFAIRANKTRVDMSDINQAYDTIMLGYEVNGMQRSNEEIYRTAIHESGHALARVLQEHARPLYKVSITPRNQALGVTVGIPAHEIYNYTEKEMLAEIIVCLAGGVAEELACGHRDTGNVVDLQYARQYATALVMQYGMTEEFKDISFEEFIDCQFNLPDAIATKLHHAIAQIIAECRTQAEQLLTQHKKDLLAVADLLVEQGTISGDLVYELCDIDKPSLEFHLH
ncbi:AAA family ATPase [Candidatus Babeliales bacterium]|nr:AAA family ATPase [Candidatus Babeliales bacterium]